MAASSDSSMDDCNFGLRSDQAGLIGVQIPLWTIVTFLPAPGSCRLFRVQIPLWTIVTFGSGLSGRFQQRSDSSMDDCNLNLSEQLDPPFLFRFLYGRL